MEVGMMIWGTGLLFNILHDEDLREIRRASRRKQIKLQEEAKKEGKKGDEEVKVEKVYMMPKNLLFQKVLYAHYLFEWMEWCGWWMMGGWGFTPGRIFVVNEIAVMLPRAIQGKRWYVENFGKEKVGGRNAVIPYLL